MDASHDPAEKNRYAQAKRAADYTIDQAWHTYSAEEHSRWDRLFTAASATLRSRACPEFLEALGTLRLSEAGIPDMQALSARLEPLTGWQVVPVTDLVPDEIFFDHLANKRFPAGAFIRPESEMDYLEEPDIFHDVFGHVPLLANPVFSEFMQAYGKGGLRAMRAGRLANLARLYWYTVEFGLIRSAGGLRIFGAGIMSSTAESRFALEDPSPHRIAFDPLRVMRTDYIIDDFQKTYFVIDDLQSLLDACYTDFAPHYAALADLPDFAPHELAEEDRILHHGSQHYFAAR